MRSNSSWLSKIFHLRLRALGEYKSSMPLSSSANMMQVGFKKNSACGALQEDRNKALAKGSRRVLFRLCYQKNVALESNASISNFR